ncbi:unnamed protein product [Nezara viridula]|uniref:glutathione transferase n=1 Tax=Nezara viridula TaxID=85310 RepID=A0A9P0H5V6_NEZVI|nr:unnamed protein product [Nezara viridula]
MVVKLTYFAMSGRGEPIRLLLSYSKTEFEDIRIGTAEEWQKLKPTLKLPHLPMLEVDGKTYFQAFAICRYLARKAGLNGSSEEEGLAIDATVDTLMDMITKIIPAYYRPDSEERSKLLKALVEDTIPFYLNIIEKQLEENNGFLVAGKLTWADFVVLTVGTYLPGLFKVDILADFPKLKEHHQKISELPGIKEWIEKRPADPEDYRTLFF